MHIVRRCLPAGLDLEVLTEVVIELNTRRWARSGSAMASRAAVSRVGLVAVEVGEASRLASDGEAGGVEGSLELGGAVGSEVLGTVGNGAPLVVRDPHGEVVPIDERYYGWVCEYQLKMF